MVTLGRRLPTRRVNLELPTLGTVTLASMVRGSRVELSTVLSVRLVEAIAYRTRTGVYALINKSRTVSVISGPPLITFRAELPITACTQTFLRPALCLRTDTPCSRNRLWCHWRDIRREFT